MIKIKKEAIECGLGIQLKDKCVSLGVDGAAKTGWAIVTVSEGDVNIDYGSMDTKKLVPMKRYVTFTKFFDELITADVDRIVVEDGYLKYFFKGRKPCPQVVVLKSLTRVSMIPIIIGIQKGIKPANLKFITPAGSRKAIGLNSKQSKEKVQAQFFRMTGITLDDEDVIDAIILAFNGALK